MNDKRISAEYHAYMQMGSSPCEDCDNYECRTNKISPCEDSINYDKEYLELVEKFMNR